MNETRPMVFVLLEDERDLPLVAFGDPLGDVIALCCAPAGEARRVDELLARAAAQGAKRVARVVDPVLAGVDYLAIAHVLACAVRHLCEASPEAPMLVLAGDRGRGAVGPAVAERLAVPHLGAVRALSVEGTRATVDRLCGAEVRRYAGSTPAVFGCVMGAEKADKPEDDTKPQIESLALETLQITAPELQYRRRFRPLGGAGPTSRPHLVSNVELLGERLARDGLWPVPGDDEAQGAPGADG